MATKKAAKKSGGTSAKKSVSKAARKTADGSGANKAASAKRAAGKSSAKKAAARKTASKAAAKKSSGRRYSPGASKDVEREMRAMKEGKLKTGTGKKVTNPKQAIAIGLAEARREGKKVPPAPKKR